MIIVSACLVGEPVRYDGDHKLKEDLRQLVADGKAVSVCPEVLGGLAVPREPSEIVGGNGDDVWEGRAKVMTISGRDVTENFKKGALASLEVVREFGGSLVILKSGSPSCGSGEIYDGHFNGGKRSGQGVFTSLLKRYGIEVMDEHEWGTKRRK
ncbi:DUF523 domain-containing protein [Staphylococcus massiliensis]|uniref:DUF523 domain-containing protein n=1 Tax=Staphylococcus massiliensis TaxID=555791 RepID=UPI000586D10D|nr:DUF523 domain-containing protein [Staphylococcus massiliensis]MCG3400458.1 DUF523 domain-containing protein [Staphylococcus massiliensis]MCG3402176.1 DUF523 domain-containing protein [Staphylococcus massiliensis]